MFILYTYLFYYTYLFSGLYTNQCALMSTNTILNRKEKY